MGKLSWTHFFMCVCCIYRPVFPIILRIIIISYLGFFIVGLWKRDVFFYCDVR